MHQALFAYFRRLESLLERRCSFNMIDVANSICHSTVLSQTTVGQLTLELMTQTVMQISVVISVR
jgi:hypothetical protein